MKEENIRKKSKFIIYNNNLEILAFKLNMNTRKYKSEIVIPTLTEKGIDISNLNGFYLDIMNMIPLKEVKFLTTKKIKNEIFESNNFKLKKIITYNIRDYFICNYNFSLDELEYINLESKKYGLEMMFISLVDFNKQRSYIDRFTKNVISSLENQYIKK